MHSKNWSDDLGLDVFRLKDPENPKLGSVARSFSGNERNRMFLQRDGNFEDVSLVSGADSRCDGRGFAILDIDQDGFLDMAVPSTMKPRLKIFRNRHGENKKNSGNAGFIRLEGGHTTSESQDQWSSRDAVGARIIVTMGDIKRAYQISCGEGLASQNSRWIHIGMGKSKMIDRIEIQWPSGKSTVHHNIPAGARTVFFEMPNKQPLVQTGIFR